VTSAVARCPTCKRAVSKDGNKAFPFCSTRCQLVDLGRWLDEEYRIPSDEQVKPDDDEKH
jgi:uncharacterized protein